MSSELRIADISAAVGQRVRLNGANRAAAIPARRARTFHPQRAPGPHPIAETECRNAPLHEVLDNLFALLIDRKGLYF